MPLRVRALRIGSPVCISGYRQHSFCCGLVAKLCLTLGPWAHFQANGPVLPRDFKLLLFTTWQSQF